MNRCSISKLLCLAAMYTMGVTVAPPSNILLIVSEDNGPELGCYGDPYAKTPRLGFFNEANAADKFAMANFHWDVTSTQIALWVIVVDPEIKSLFDAFIKVIGLFMGVLGGLFVLGAITRRANATGAMIGAVVGAGFMFYLWRFTDVNGYLYTASGISTCLAVGYMSSLTLPQPTRDLTGLTIYTLGVHEMIGKAHEDAQS